MDAQTQSCKWRKLPDKETRVTTLQWAGVARRPWWTCSWWLFLPVRSWQGQDSGGRDSEKWSCSRYIWKRGQTGFALWRGWVWDERKSQVKCDSQALYLNLWKNGVPFTEMIRTQEVPVDRGVSAGPFWIHYIWITSRYTSGHLHITWWPVSRHALMKLLVLHACSVSPLIQEVGLK